MENVNVGAGLVPARHLANQKGRPQGAPLRSPWLNRYAQLVVLATLLLILAGGMVTTTDSGLAVPDWPLSYGQWMPPMVGGIFYEHLHRIIASAVGLLTVILTIWIGFAEKRRWVRWLGIAALGAVVTQGLLGGMTVLFLLPAPVSIAHACLAQTFFALLVSIAFFTSKEWGDCRGGLYARPSSGESERAPTRDAPTLKKMLLMTTAFTYAQLILGATARHTDSQLVIVSHVAGAFFVLIHVAMLYFYIFRHYADDKKLLYPAVFLGITFFAQLILGMGTLVYTQVLADRIQPSFGEVFFVTGHQTLGALLLGTSVLLVLRVYRRGKLA